MSFSFGKPATSGFGTQNTATGGFGTQNTTTGGFGTQNTTTSGFGTQNTGGFGTQNTTTSGFGTQNTGGFTSGGFKHGSCIYNQTGKKITDIHIRLIGANFAKRDPKAGGKLFPNATYSSDGTSVDFSGDPGINPGEWFWMKFPKAPPIIAEGYLTPNDHAMVSPKIYPPNALATVGSNNLKMTFDHSSREIRFATSRLDYVKYPNSVISMKKSGREFLIGSSISIHPIRVGDILTEGIYECESSLITFKRGRKIIFQASLDSIFLGSNSWDLIDCIIQSKFISEEHLSDIHSLFLMEKPSSYKETIFSIYNNLMSSTKGLTKSAISKGTLSIDRIFT